MLAVDILDILDCEELSISNVALFETDYKYAFASDLMSDALFLIEDQGANTVFLTGLCNIQSLRTAEMLDIDFIIYVRDKRLDEETIKIAKSMNMNIFTTKNNMFEASGKLYLKGLKSPR